jgi:hypothetical protein
VHNVCAKKIVKEKIGFIEGFLPFLWWTILFVVTGLLAGIIYGFISNRVEGLIRIIIIKKKILYNVLDVGKMEGEN